MATQHNDHSESSLRARAEQKLDEQSIETSPLSLDDSRTLIHELRVHQIELELQNEELRLTQLALETSYRKYSDLYEFSPVGLLMLDTDAHIVEANLTFARLIELDRDKVINRHLSDFIEGDTQDAFHFFCHALRSTNQAQQCEIALRTATQQRLEVRLDGSVLNLPDAAVVFRISVSDLTLQKQTEVERMALAAEKHRIKVLADFVRDISHDLRTPIATITTGLYLVGKATDKQIQLEKIEMVTRELFYLVSILEQLQQMAVLDSTPQLSLELGSVNDLVVTVLSKLERQAEMHRVSLVHQLQGDLPLVYLDAERIAQAISLLVNRALQFSAQGGMINITTHEENTDIKIVIADDGLGIAADKLPHIFDHFFKPDESRDVRSGAGLGLPLVKRIVELHHGSIEVSSNSGIRTIFVITLPQPH